MTDTGFTYMHMWEITDPTRPLAALKVEACAGLDAVAAAAGARIVGDITWELLPDRLIARCPAVPLDTTTGPDPRETVDDIAVERAMRGERLALNKVEQLAAVERLARQGKGAAEIARILGKNYSSTRRHLASVA